MTDISSAFAKGKAAVAFIMGGDDSLEKTKSFITSAESLGADMIEVGIPFSDPIAESPSMQAASARALACGTDAAGILDMLSSVRVGLPIILVTYANPVYRFGYENFFARCAEAGVSGVIFNDIPREESADVRAAAQAHGVEIIDVIASSSGHSMGAFPSRIKKICPESRGFISLCGQSCGAEAAVACIREVCSLPVLVPCDELSADSAFAAAKAADGVVLNVSLAEEGAPAAFSAAAKAVHAARCR